MQLLARVSAVAPPVSPCPCPLSDLGPCVPPPVCPSRHQDPPPPVLGPFWNIPLTSCADLLRSQQTPAMPVVQFLFLKQRCSCVLAFVPEVPDSNRGFRCRTQMQIGYPREPVWPALCVRVGLPPQPHPRPRSPSRVVAFECEQSEVDVPGAPILATIVF